MSINGSAGSLLYAAYKNAGPSAILIVPAIVLNFVAISGILMNALVVFATIMTKSLHGTANYLLAFICFCGILHQSGHSIFLYISLSGTNFIDSFTSTLLALPMIFGMNAAIFGMMLAAADRLIAISAILWHRKYGNKAYLTLLTILCSIYGLFWDLWMIKGALNKPNIPVTGLLSDLIGISSDLALYNEILNGIAILCYLLIWIIVKRRKAVTNVTNARLTKSLAAIIGINIGGYFVSVIFFQIFHTLILMQFMDFIRFWQCGIYISTMAINISVACNAPILYMTSLEYRKAFSQCITKLAATICWMKNSGNAETRKTIFIKRIAPSAMEVHNS